MYAVFFGIGIGFIVLSLVLGGLLDINGIGFGFLKPTLIAVFLVVAGGIGLILTPRLGEAPGAGIVLAISLVGGVAVASAVNSFVIVPLYAAQNTSTFDKEDTIGANARVISRIPRGGYGKISYSFSGSIVTGPAKSEDGSEIEIGTDTQIVRIEGSTYFVKSPN